MDDTSATNGTPAREPEAVIDLSEGAEFIGTTPQQTRLVEGLLMGLNQTASAKRAGYQGEGTQIRSTASNACRSQKVRALLAWAEGQGKGVPDAPGDRDELKRILWRHARSGDKTMSIKAAEALERIGRNEAQAEAKSFTNVPFEDVAREYVAMEPYGPLIWVLLWSSSWGREGRKPLANMPLRNEVAPMVAGRWPGIWAELEGTAADGGSFRREWAVEYLGSVDEQSVARLVDGRAEPVPETVGAQEVDGGRAIAAERT